MSEFRMSGGKTSPLTERFEFLNIKSAVEKVEQTVKQHRTVTGGKNKFIASYPAGIVRIEPEIFIPEGKSVVGTSHRHTGVSAFGFLDGFCCQNTDRVRRFRGKFYVVHILILIFLHFHWQNFHISIIFNKR